MWGASSDALAGRRRLRATQMHDTFDCITTPQRHILPTNSLAYNQPYHNVVWRTVSLEGHQDIAYSTTTLSRPYQSPPPTIQDKFPRHRIPTESEGTKKDIPSTSSLPSERRNKSTHGNTTQQIHPQSCRRQSLARRPRSRHSSRLSSQKTLKAPLSSLSRFSNVAKSEIRVHVLSQPHSFCSES
jgi:hypothetical protein